MELHLYVNSEYPRSAAMGDRIEDHVRQVGTALDVGFAGIAAGHHLSIGEVQWLPPLPFLSYLAGVFPGVRIATSVLLLPYVNPVQLAETVAFLDVLTKGRMSLGVGPGWVDAEAAALGMARSERHAAFRANLVAVDALLRGEPIVVRRSSGEEVEVTLGLRPVQQPRPPLWLGATGARSAQRNAALVDTLVMSAHLEVEDQVPVLEAFRSGRNGAEGGDTIIVRNVFVAETRREAFEIAAPHLGDSYASFKDWGLFDELVRDPTAAGQVQRAAVARSIVGDPDDVAAVLRSIASTLGARRFIVRTQWQGMSTATAERSIALLGRAVLPQLAPQAAVQHDERRR